MLNRRLSTLALAFLATSMDPELYRKYENNGTEAASAMLRMWGQFTAEHGRTGVRVGKLWRFQFLLFFMFLTPFVKNQMSVP